MCVNRTGIQRGRVEDHYTFLGMDDVMHYVSMKYPKKLVVMESVRVTIPLAARRFFWVPA